MQIEIPHNAPWQMHDPLVQRLPYFRMFFARTPGGGILGDVYFNCDVRGDWIEYGTDNAHGFDMSFEEWCGVAPARHDRDVVWC